MYLRVYARSFQSPGTLKHAKDVDINYLHGSLAHAHASVLKATAEQHGIRFTGECRMFDGQKEPPDQSAIYNGAL